MRSFLDQIADRILNDPGGDPGKMTVVFPNKRAGLFFARALSAQVKKPVWSPRIFSIEEFLYSLSDKVPSDPISLVLDLYKTYREITGFEETFDRFYFWGDMLLRDFDEIDRYLVKPDKIFYALKDLKEIDAAFPFLTDEQREVIRHFWGNLSDPGSGFKEGFLKFWGSLLHLYQAFQKRLVDRGHVYPGMIYREICTQIKEERMNWNGGKIIFAGFNALTTSEELILKWFIKNGKAEIFWDTDTFYVTNPWHEAGTFHRRYMRDPVFGNTFPRQMPDSIKNNRAEIEVVAASSNIAQAQWAGKRIKELMKEGVLEHPEKTVIVLPDESMVTHLLSAIPDEIEKVNITIAYPVRTTPLYSFFELVIELHENRRTSSNGTWFSHTQVLPLLSHPVLKAKAGEKAAFLSGEIRNRNMIFINRAFLCDGGILDEIFSGIPEDENIMDYFLRLVLAVRNEESANSFDDEIQYYFYRLFKRIGEAFSGGEIDITFSLLKRMFRQVSRIERLSFTGEPLEGIQVMGILETRNLDFENVIILNTSEGSFPGNAGNNSFIPYNVRRAFGLPNFEHTGSIYAYLFYRLLHRSKKIWLVYNSEEASQNSGEPSRFIRQLKYEQEFKIKEKVIIQHIKVNHSEPLVIQKDEEVLHSLKQFLDPGNNTGKFLTPSALNTYLDCPVSFYFKYLLGVKEVQEVSADFDSLIFGNILHKAMEELYKPLMLNNGGVVKHNDINRLGKEINSTVNACFGRYFGLKENEDFQFEGRNVLGREIIIRIVKRILEIDAAYAPFKIIDTEKAITYSYPIEREGKKQTVNVKGIIDRIDEKEGRIRIVDYKSGKDASQFDSVEALFGDKEKKRNKAVFQTLFYAMVFKEQEKGRTAVPCLYNAKELSQENFSPELRAGKGAAQSLVDKADRVDPLLVEYREHFKQLIGEIFNAEVPFTHREENGSCKFCERSGYPV